MNHITPLTDGIELLNGEMFSYEDPDVEMITIEYLADVLSRICRFAGHVKGFYSVAQHSFNASMIAPKGHELAALLHDTAEAFINDIPTPLKIRLPELKDIEVRIESALAAKFGTPYPLSPEVKTVDLQMLALEKDALKPSDSRWETLEGIEYEHLKDRVILQPMSPEVAKILFLSRYRALTDGDVA